MTHPIVVLRTKQHLSRAELAQRAGVAPSTIRCAEANLSCNVKNAIRIARALDATVEVLFAGCL